jgi:hypothetical protein
MVAVEHGWDVTWYVGSANITATAFTGTNIEVMASIRERKGRAEGDTGFGIQRFLHQFMKLCVPYKRGEEKPTDPEVIAAQALIEKARDVLIEAPLKIVCTRLDGQWQWQLRGKVSLPKGVQVTAWPLSVPETQAQQLALPLTADLPISHLTAFVAFHLKVGVRGVDDIRLVRKFPTEGLPDERIQQVLRSLIDSPEKFLRFLRALLGGLEGMVDWGTKSQENKGDGAWGDWITGETLLEDMLRTASREPARLDSVRRLITDLRATEEGRAIVPDDLFAVWSAVDGALGGNRGTTA